jgi:4-amino-4-deoxy-L-arabinose transferase-like glycosyltransferase
MPGATSGSERSATPCTGAAAASDSPSLSPLARGPVLAIACSIGALLLVTSGRYGYFGDELYFLAAGRRLDWGYADQPPLVPLLAVALDTVFPGSVVGLRLPAAALAALGVVVAALLARELGGDARAQVLTAAAYAVPLNLVINRLLLTSTVDTFLWTLVTWLLVRWVRTRRDRLLLWAGLVTAIASQAKLLVGAFWVVLVMSALILVPVRCCAARCCGSVRWWPWWRRFRPCCGRLVTAGHSGR